MDVTEKPKLLIVEDDKGLQNQLRWCFGEYEVLIAQDRSSAIALLRRHEPAVVTLDLGLPPDPANASEGLKALEEILALAPKTKVIVVTGNDEREHAVNAIAMGAYDFYQKPVEQELLRMIVNRAFHVRRLELEFLAQSQIGLDALPLPGLIATSPQMRMVCRMVEKVAPTDVTVLLHGESGTGKEVLARALHKLSGRPVESFVALNCAAIPETLLESELFGYERGAFTGAVKQTKGKIERANGGTLFLDEIGDLPFALQAKLLRFIQERVIERIGGHEEIPVDIRIICATHRNLQTMAEKNEFRQDLYFRLSEMTIEIPPLRDRKGDVLLLAQMILATINGASKSRKFSEEALMAMESYGWPGNVRELENKIRRAAILSENAQLTAEDLQLADMDAEPDLLRKLNLRQVREEAESNAIRQAIAYAKGNMTRAAELLGVSRPTLYSLLSRYGLDA